MIKTTSNLECQMDFLSYFVVEYPQKNVHIFKTCAITAIYMKTIVDMAYTICIYIDIIYSMSRHIDVQISTQKILVNTCIFQTSPK